MLGDVPVQFKQKGLYTLQAWHILLSFTYVGMIQSRQIVELVQLAHPDIVSEHS
jgi:hypothetical protein